MLWSLLILSLPSRNTTARMRAWRALKAAGAAVLRDGVYLLPASATARILLDGVAADVRAHGGTAHCLDTEAEGADYAALFDRSAELDGLLAEIAALQAGTLTGDDRMSSDVAAARREGRKLRKAFEALVESDFFPGQAQRRAAAALDTLEVELARRAGPDEPQPAAPAAIARLDRADYQGRTWATRARPWVDRLACGWLIRRFIDPQAHFLWLAPAATADPCQVTDYAAACPPGALGYDYDGAAFSHVGQRVSFETLLASFDLETAALKRLGLVVRALDAGGPQPAEAAGVERVLAGMRRALGDDDQLLQIAAGVFEGLWIAFENEEAPP